MHLVLLGIMRKLMNAFLHKVPYKVSNSQKKQMDSNIALLKKYIPSDFNRKPRSLAEFERYKATEFRQILFYTGIIIFKDIIKKEMYQNFLILMYIMRILSDVTLVSDAEMLAYARKLCYTFVKQFKKIYKTINVSYNVHSLLHLVDDVERLGVVDSFSAFPFESSLGNLRRRLRSSNSPLAQITFRISEGYKISKTKIDSCNTNELLISGHKVDSKTVKNSCVLLKDKSIVLITDLRLGKPIAAFKCKKLKPASKYPIDSSILDLHISKIKERQIIREKDIFRKCCIFPVNNGNFMILPLL